MWKKAFYVLLISILPIIELRGAIPVGAALGLPFYIYAPLSVLGNLLPVPFILFFIPKILDLLERIRFLRPLIQWIREKANRGLVKMQKHDTKQGVQETVQDGQSPEEAPTLTEEVSTKKKQARLSVGAFVGLFLFVMIPLPGTGAWTGSLVASLFDFPKKDSFLAITLGVLGACVIMTLASEGLVSIFKIFL